MQTLTVKWCYLCKQSKSISCFRFGCNGCRDCKAIAERARVARTKKAGVVPIAAAIPTETLALIGAAVRRRRKAKGWKFRDLATAVGCSVSFACNAEMGRSGSLPFLFKAAAALGIKPSKLLEEAGL